MLPITSEQFELVNGWTFGNIATVNLIKDAGFAIRNVSGFIEEEYMCVISLGDAGTDQLYYQHTNNAPTINFLMNGAVNQCIKIFGTGSGIGISNNTPVNFKNYFKIFARGHKRLYSQSSNIAIGATVLSYQTYRFSIVTRFDARINALDSDMVNAPYNNMSITYYNDPVPVVINNQTHYFNVIIDADVSAGESRYGSANAEQIYEFVQYSLRQPIDIDSGPAFVLGKSADQLLNFLGSNLNTTRGVYIKKFNIEDNNRVLFTDIDNEIVSHPFISTGALSFDSNFVNDTDAIYRMFYKNINGAEFGTNNAIVVLDAENNPITGKITQSTIPFTYGYEDNTQNGRTPGTDADIVIVATGSKGAMYVQMEGTIKRTNANLITLVTRRELNYKEI